MIKKLRKKIVIAMMAALTIVLVAMIAGMNIHNYVGINHRADQVLQMLKENEGVLKDPPIKYTIEDEPKKEDRMNSPYFTATFSETGELESIDTSHLFFNVDEERLNKIAEKANQNKKNSAFLSQFKYLKFTLSNGKHMIAFLDLERELRTFHNFLKTSLLMSAIGYGVVFALVIIFSSFLTKPMVESYQKQKQFITDANHELKTPLTIIDASTDILEMNYGENEWLSSIHEQVKRLSDLTKQLVFLSRMDEENRKIDMYDFSLSEVAEEVASQYGLIFQNQNQKFQKDIAKNLSYFGNMAMIRELFTILLDNARKYTKEKGKVSLSVVEVGKNKKIIMSNDVESIQKGNLDFLFERFYRLDSSRNSESGGHGIGLSIAQAIVEVHKGKMHAHSNDGKTITFTILL